MRALLLREAHEALISERSITCQTCPAPIEAERDGEKHCRGCQSYWDDVAAGLFDDHSDLWSDD
ncbi:hypothetical protein [Aureimonas phyllosphaerae]|uniref:Uncharacterized protein n=1 Tax=Aureimonas phyllosphaerae TaxID=1166078 RepID=A0A7W6BZ90_9HYPH|nr:hypothetical protein [Aureimonas phyllosphaerae]MBB3937918.1 hypothetical protein [Aureimonas phyllosphaerae]MBB3961909.1 hypothetical protein [Aureimonas phyllosphaerae]